MYIESLTARRRPVHPPMRPANPPCTDLRRPTTHAHPLPSPQPPATKGQMLQSMIGSSIYMSPQVASGSYDLACDMWSAGAVMYVLLTGRPPIQGPSDAKTLALVRRGRWSFQGSLWQGVTAEAKQLVAALLAVKPSARSTAASALLHPWIQWSVGTVGV